MKSRNKSKKSKVAIAVKRRRQSAHKKSAARSACRNWWSRIKSAAHLIHLIDLAHKLVPHEWNEKVIDLMTALLQQLA